MAELERVIKRGGVYWIRSMDEWGGTAGSLGRPGVVVSNDYGNEHSRDINVVFCSTSCKPHVCNVPISCTDRPTVAKCNQLAVVDRDRFGQKMGDVSEEEMEKINETLAMCLGLTIHKREVDEALAAEKAKVAGLEDELMAKRVEIKMVERMYEKALDMLAGLKLTGDLQKPRQPKVPKLVPDEPEVDEELERTVTVKSKKPRATTVIMDDLEYHGDGKVNVNTATAKEICEKTGLSLTVCYGITGFRNRNGKYSSLSDLLNAPRVTQHHLDKYGKMLTV